MTKTFWWSTFAIWFYPNTDYNSLKINQSNKEGFRIPKTKFCSVANRHFNSMISFDFRENFMANVDTSDLGPSQNHSAADKEGVN